MRVSRRSAARLLRGRVLPGRCSICGFTLFDERGVWLRDAYACVRCGSIPRHRALALGIELASPDWPFLTIFESSPGSPVSDLLATRCPSYIGAHFFEDVAPGAMVDGVRCEDLRALTLGDNAVDMVVTGDVFEHVVDPAKAFREIARVLQTHGAHVFTVPIYARPKTVVRVADDGSKLMPAEYHGNPIADGRSLVVREWGDDIVEFIRTETGMITERLQLSSRWRGIRGEMTDVLISRKN